MNEKIQKRDLLGTRFVTAHTLKYFHQKVPEIDVAMFLYLGKFI